MSWFILLSCLGWYHLFAIDLVEFLFVSSSTVIVFLFFSLFFLLILDRTCFGVLSGVFSDELVKLSDEFFHSSSLLSAYKVSYLFWQLIGSFSIFLGLNSRSRKSTNRNTRQRCEICSNLTIKTPDQRYWWCRT